MKGKSIIRRRLAPRHPAPSAPTGPTPRGRVSPEWATANPPVEQGTVVIKRTTKVYPALRPDSAASAQAAVDYSALIAEATRAATDIAALVAAVAALGRHGQVIARDDRARVSRSMPASVALRRLADQLTALSAQYQSSMA